MNQHHVTYYLLNTNYHQISMASIAFRLARFTDAFSRQQSGMRLRKALSDKIATTSEEEPPEGYRLYYKVPDNHIAWTRGNSQTGEIPKGWRDVHLLALTQGHARQLCKGGQVYTQWFPFGLSTVLQEWVSVYLGPTCMLNSGNACYHPLPSPSNTSEFGLRPPGFQLSDNQSMLPYELEDRLKIDLKSVFVNAAIANQLRAPIGLPTLWPVPIKPQQIRSQEKPTLINKVCSKNVASKLTDVGVGVKVLTEAAKYCGGGSLPQTSILANKTPAFRPQRERREEFLVNNSPGTLFGKDRAKRAIPLITLQHNRSRGVLRSELNRRLIDEVKRRGKDLQLPFMSDALFLIRDASRHWERWKRHQEGLPDGCSTKDDALYELLTAYGFSGKNELKTLFAIITWNGASYKHPPFK